MRAFSVMALAVALTGAAGSRAQDAAGQDRLIELDQIVISHELCDFPLSTEQAESAKAESDGVVEVLGLDPDDAQKLYDQYTEVMRRQKASGLCDPKGEWAKTYAKLVAALPKTAP